MIKKIINEFIESVDSVYGVFLDGCRGLESSLDSFEQSVLIQIEQNKKKASENKQESNISYNLSIQDFDSSCLIYSKGTKGQADYRILHYTSTQAEFKQRNSPGGNNYKFIGNMSLISIYAYWEKSCRNLIAAHHRVQPCQVQSEIFGDLRWLRASILHHKGIALPEVERCKIFKWYKRNDAIFIDGNHMEEIVSSIKKSIYNLYKIKAYR